MTHGDLGKNSLTYGRKSKIDNTVIYSDTANSPKNDKWSLVKSRNTIRRDKLENKKSEKRVMGSRKIEGGFLKAAVVTADVFVGRVECNVTAENVSTYVKDVFAIDPIYVTKLNIRSDQYAAFKINVKVSDRDKLFDENLWPQDIIVKKFYNRHRHINDDNRKGNIGKKSPVKS